MPRLGPSYSMYLCECSWTRCLWSHSEHQDLKKKSLKQFVWGWRINIFLCAGALVLLIVSVIVIICFTYLLILFTLLIFAIKCNLFILQLRFFIDLPNFLTLIANFNIFWLGERFEWIKYKHSVPTSQITQSVCACVHAKEQIFSVAWFITVYYKIHMKYFNVLHFVGQVGGF
jgi:hypothetical protein